MTPTTSSIPARRRLATPVPFRPLLGFPSLTSAARDLASRTDESVEAALADLPRLATVDWVPTLNLAENDDGFVVTVELPGLAAPNVKVEFLDGVLTVRGEKEEVVDRKTAKQYLMEREYGAFERTVTMGGGIAEDRITAALDNGVLTVRLPKTEERRKRRTRIEILST